ncbi:MAG TPA: putative lipid II flippase FtsW [Dehalococcoidia bacterium]|nr:putative lipid II flippase FtsW [Dehalococcoidia bacterium]
MLLVAAAMLVMAGLLAVYSSSFSVGYHLYDDANFFIARQAVFALIGVGVMVFFMRMDYNRLRMLSVPMLGAALVGLILVLLPGIGGERNGASRWLELGPVSVQPSEWAKLAIVIYVSAWLASRGDDINRFSLGFVPFVLLMSIVGGLIVAEPDMGTTIVVVLTASTLFFVAGAPLSHLGLLLTAGGAVSYLVIQEREYQMDRLMSFMDPGSDPQGNGFQILQLLIALGSGGIFGLGIGESRQAAFYVPGSHTDGVLAIVGEELGFIGLIGVLGLFVFFIYRAVKVTVAAPDRFGTLVGIGIISWIGFQTLINLGGITRTIPLTGVPVPFLSYGGSSLIALMAAVGVLLSISRYSADQAQPYRPRPQTRSTGPGRRRPTTERRPAYGSESA